MRARVDPQVIRASRMPEAVGVDLAIRASGLTEASFRAKASILLADSVG